jgi:hypothetical protein
MLARFSHSHARINILFRVGVNSFAIVIYLVGAVTLSVGTLLTALHLTYRWLRDGAWHFYSLADLLAGENPSEPLAQSESWLLETPLLVAMPAVGGTLTVAGLAIFFSGGLFWHKRNSKGNNHLKNCSDTLPSAPKYH